jgi:predicted ATPase
LKFDRINLLLGLNGTGKSTIFDVLFKIKNFVAGNCRVSDTFSLADLTRWQTLKSQNFEIELQNERGTYLYKLSIEHDIEKKLLRVEKETLTLDSKPLFEFVNGMAHLFHDDHTPGPVVSFDWSQSGIAVLQPRSDNTKLYQFRMEMSRIIIASVNPFSITRESKTEERELSYNSANFVSWYRWLSQENQGIFMDLFTELRKVLPGFDSFSLRESGEDTRVLKVIFEMTNSTKKPLSFDFHELSEGQKVLIELYSLLYGLRNHGYSLFLDEPENYLSSREIQPWLSELNDLCGSKSFEQTLLISHHPELIDYFGPSCGKWLERDKIGPVRVVEKKISNDLTLSEAIARGWDL